MHWDGKLVPDTEKFLAIPKLTSGSRQSMAFAVREALNDRQLKDKILAMSFDTSSNKTTNGAYPFPKVQFKMELLWLHFR